ncbi:Mitochondrial intermediate peptidase, partial [Coemansia nantahalensis]
MLAYASDYALLGTTARPYRMGRPDSRYRLSMMVSLDHTIWFHAPFRADEWLLYVMESPRGASGRNLGIGRIYRRDGVLVATTAQEGVVRGTDSEADPQTLEFHSVARADDVHLRDLFDLPTTTTLGSTWFRHGQPTGLLMESRFVSPKTFRAAGKQAVAEAGKLAQWVLDAQTAEEKRAVVKCLDQLSDALCRVMDVAELVRQVHPDSSWQAAAEDVFSEMLEYMNELNTHVDLYAKLVDVMDDPEIAATLDPVE